MPRAIQRLKIKAPAKVNLNLMVKDKRSDGFHNIKSVFLAVDFGDTLCFEPISVKNAVEITMEWQNGLQAIDIPMEKNIVFQALSIFRSKTGYDQGFNIKVEKHIPAGGGLGGGSSNAAAALLALNILASKRLSKEALLETAACLGSDVPFFIHETPAALVTGRGEHIQPIEAPRCFVVLVNPGFPSNTADAFRLLSEKRAKSTEVPGTFLEVFDEPEKSVYNSIIAQLRELGADSAGLSGAGSTCFGVFSEVSLGGDIEAKARNAAVVMRKRWPFAECTFPPKPVM